MVLLLVCEMVMVVVGIKSTSGACKVPPETEVTEVGMPAEG